MTVIDYKYFGRTVKAHQVGRYVVHVCCREVLHAVSHLESKTPILCGLTQQQAVILADTLSLYGEDCPITFVEGPGVQMVLKWARFVLRLSMPDEILSYAEYHEKRHGVRPRPGPPALIQSSSIPQRWVQ